MEDFQLLADLHLRQKRQGPGGSAATKMAIDLAMLDPTAPLKIADIGCGTGASTLDLARRLNAEITAVDFLPEFIKKLIADSEKEGLGDKITAVVGPMENLQFEDDELDVIWSEGAIYNIGFEKGVNEWRRFLKPEGILVASELTWITGDRPTEIQEHWNTEYAEVDTASAKIKVLEDAGYSPVAYFFLPEHCWFQNYYGPLQDSFTEFLRRNANSESAQAIVEAERKEIALYEKYKGYYSYGVYIAKKLG